jgi:aminoglycoside phosphotransferase (APT) family kinase protein
MTQLGRIIAPGRTSDVYEYGRGSVVKVPRPGVPAAWPAIEAEITAAVHSNGLPTPAVRGLEIIEGRESVVFERIDGRSMWQQLRDGGRGVSSVAGELAEIQLAICGAEPPPSLIDFADRVGAKVDAAHVLSVGERNEAQRILASLPRGSSLCHGDLHPGNVLMSDRGPIVIDWYDAAVGSPIADFVRSSLLIRPPLNASELLHLPGSSPELLKRLHDHYVERVLVDLDVAPVVARCWEAVLAVSRLSEHAEADDSGLLALWRGRRKATASPLLDAISAIR